MTQNVCVAKDITSMRKEIKTILEKTLQDANRPIIVGLSGGSMIDIMSPVLNELHKTNTGKLKLFCVDERLVPLDDKDSNTGSYLKGLNKELGNEFVQVTDVDNAEKAAKEFETKLRALDIDKTDDGYPTFDVLFLGLGPDGHTCSLFPDHELLTYKGDSWIMPIENSPKPPPRRITITIPVCNSAKQVIFLVKGKEKAELIKKLVTDKDETYPAGKVKPQNPVKWILDQESAKNINIK